MSRSRRAWISPSNRNRVRWYEYAPDGRRLAHAKTFTNRRFALLFRNRLNARLALGDDLCTSSATMEEAIRRFFAAAGLTKSHNTLEEYAISVGLFARLAGLSTPMDSITVGLAERFLSGRLLRCKPDTCAKHARTLHAWFAWAMSRGLCHHNPFHSSSIRRKPTARIRPIITDADLSRLMACCENQDQRLAIALAITTGLDRGVIARLAVQQLDFEACVIRYVRPKTGKVGSVPLHRSLIKPLRGRCAGSSQARPILAGIESRYWWPRVRRAAGLPLLLFRDLRAVAADRLRRAGLPESEACRLLGHGSIVTTARHYSMPTPASAEAVQRLPIPGFPPTPSAKRERRA